MDAGRHRNEPETDPAGPRSARGSVVGKVLAGLALLAVGLCLGIVLGSVASGPRLFVRRLTEPLQRVEIAALAEAAPDADPLTEFRELQARTDSAAPEPPPSGPTRASVAAPPPKPESPEQKAAERVLAELRAQRVPEPDRPTPSRVIQVAAYTERGAAGALAQRLSQDGYDSYVSHTLHQGIDRYRVRVRPAPGTDLDAVANRLKRKGLSVWVTRE